MLYTESGGNLDTCVYKIMSEKTAIPEKGVERVFASIRFFGDLGARWAARMSRIVSLHDDVGLLASGDPALLNRMEWWTLVVQGKGTQARVFFGLGVLLDMVYCWFLGSMA